MTPSNAGFDASADLHPTEEFLALALVLQEQLTGRITALALKLRQHPERMVRFVELVEQWLLDLRFCEDDVLLNAGHALMDAFRDQPRGPASQSGGGMSLN